MRGDSCFLREDAGEEDKAKEKMRCVPADGKDSGDMSGVDGSVEKWAIRWPWFRRSDTGDADAEVARLGMSDHLRRCDRGPVHVYVTLGGVCIVGATRDDALAASSLSALSACDDDAVGVSADTGVSVDGGQSDAAKSSGLKLASSSARATCERVTNRSPARKWSAHAWWSSNKGCLA